MRENNFGLLRLVLALLVLYSHSYPLAEGRVVRDPFDRMIGGQHSLGSLSVDCFFAISGYLISQSWFRSSGVSYIRKRVTRIVPAFWVSCIISVMAGASTAPSLAQYFKIQLYDADAGIRHLLLYESKGLANGLDNDLAYRNTHFPGEINGSQWTLSPEVFCYILVAAAGAVGWLTRRTSVFMFLACWACYAFLARMPDHGLLSIARLAAFFFGGATLQFMPWVFKSPLACPSWLFWRLPVGS